MKATFIHKNFLKQISHYGDQNFNKLLQQKMKQQPRLDVELFRQKIASLKHTAAHHGLISLSAPQVKFNNRIFVVLKKPFIKYCKWTGYQDLFMSKRPEQCYDTIINPELLSYSDFKIKASQECPSVEGLKFKVWIPFINRWKYTKYFQQFQKPKSQPAFKNFQQQLNGFYGRVFDHQYRHLEGLLVNQAEICNNEIYLTDQAKEDPDNFEHLKQYRMECRYLNQQNIDKHLEQEERMNTGKSGKSKKVETATSSSSMDFSQITDKIDDNLKKKLIKSYEAAQKVKNPQQADVLKLGKPTQPNKKQSKPQGKKKKLDKGKSQKK